MSKKKQVKGKAAKEFIFSTERFFWSISRGIMQILMQGTIILSFEYAVKTGINPGIVASIFAVNLVFTLIVFFFVYG